MEYLNRIEKKYKSELKKKQNTKKNILLKLAKNFKELK